MRTVFAFGVFGVLALSAATAAAQPADLRVYQSTRDDASAEGDTVLAADPDAVYRTVTDYGRWVEMFPDVRRVVITSQSGSDARVTFIHPDGNRDNVHFHNQPTARMVWFEDTGGRAEVWAEIMFLPGDRPGTDRKSTRLNSSHVSESRMPS